MNNSAGHGWPSPTWWTGNLRGFHTKRLSCQYTGVHTHGTAFNPRNPMILHVLIAMVAGWLQRHQQQVIAYLLEENRVLKAQLGGRRLSLTDTERRRLAALAHPLGRQCLKDVATLVTPDTLLRWFKRLIAQKFDGSRHRRPLGR